MRIDGFIWGMKLTDEQWELIEPLLPPQHRRGHEARGDRQPTLLVPFLRAFSGNYEAARGGSFAEMFSLPIRLATDGCNIGEKQAHLKRSLCTCKYSVGARKVGAGRRFYRRNPLLRPKKGVLGREDQKGKGTKIMAIVEEHGYPIALHIESASPGEATLVEKDG